MLGVVFLALCTDTTRIANSSEKTESTAAEARANLMTGSSLGSSDLYSAPNGSNNAASKLLWRSNSAAKRNSPTLIGSYAEQSNKTDILS